ncbi:MAG TPA: uracil-DNA glycosylase [Methanocella sp.]|nr:uracil-DNA glycosylase [Methanocella sp.]
MDEVDKMVRILNEIDDVLRCPRCDLASTRKNVVVGSGPIDAKIMLIGEAPGKDEDTQGMPFVGAAGRVLNSTLKGAGISRDVAYITNIVKCRPPENRVPRKDEINACSVYLRKQLETVTPKLVILMGKTSAKSFLKRDVNMTDEHGKPFKHGDLTVMITYHPAATIYNRKLKGVLEADFRVAGDLSVPR